jgi:hypothetical protein
VNLQQETVQGDLRSSITRLTQFRPFGPGRLQIEQMLRGLVLTAAYEAGDVGIGSLAGFRDACMTLWGIETEIDELRDLTAKLQEDGQLYKDGRVPELL